MEANQTLPQPAEPPIDVGLWSSWKDEKDRLFVVVEKWKPPIFSGLPDLYRPYERTSNFTVLEVNREFSYTVTRENFEGSIRRGALVRVIDS